MGMSGQAGRRGTLLPRVRIYEWSVSGADREHKGLIVCMTWGRFLIEVAVGHEEHAR